MIVCPACKIAVEKDDFLPVGEHKLICRICLSIIDSGFICPKCGQFSTTCEDPFLKDSKLGNIIIPIFHTFGIGRQRNGICSICKKISAFHDFKKALRNADHISQFFNQHHTLEKLCIC